MLYQVHKINSDNSFQFVMIAPVKTIGEFYRMHRNGEVRLQRETKNGGTCRFFISRMDVTLLISEMSNMEAPLPDLAAITIGSQAGPGFVRL